MSRAPEALAAARRRLRARWSPACWLGFLVRAVPPQTIEAPEGRIHLPAHYLVGLWPPTEGPPVLYPEVAAIASPDADAALLELLRHVPGDEPVHLLRAEQVDTRLLADIVLATDRHLEAYQRAGLEAYVAAQGAARAQAIARLYTDREPGFEAMKARLLGEGPGQGEEPLA